MNAADLAGAKGQHLGADWGAAPLWRFEGDGWSIEAHGADEAAARAAAAGTLEATAASRSDVVTRAELVAAIATAVPGVNVTAMEAAVDAAICAPLTGAEPQVVVQPAKPTA